MSEERDWFERYLDFAVIFTQAATVVVFLLAVVYVILEVLL